MKATPIPLLGLLLTSILAGCAYEPEARVVDFSAVDETQPGAQFELQVKVVGLNNSKSQPIIGAFVGAAEGSQAIAKGTTGPDGIATLRVQTGQTIRVVASASGWTTEDSGRLRLGRGSSDSNAFPAMGCSGGAAQGSDGQAAGGSCGFMDDEDASGCAGGASQGSDGQAAGGWCIVTAGESDASSVSLQGDRGAVSVVLFPREVRQKLEKEIGPNLNARVTTVPDGNEWIAFQHELNEDPALHDLQMLRFQSATTTMQWSNDLLSEADFELGVGCDENTPMEETDELVPTLQRKAYNLEVEFESEGDGRWSGCPDYFVGPIVSTLNTPVTVHLESVMTFRGRSTIIPIGE